MAKTVNLEALKVETRATTLNFADKRAYMALEEFIPEEQRDLTFFRCITIIYDYLQNSLKGTDYQNEKFALVEQAYKDIVFKYKNIMEISEDSLRQTIIEGGFEDILDLVELPIDKLQMLVLYLPLLKALKGTDVGYNLILKLLTQDYELKSWLDDPQLLEDYTFGLTFLVFLNVGFDASIVQRIAKFSRSYVYPVLKYALIKAMFRSLSPVVYGRPIMLKQIKLKCFDVIDILERMYIPTYARPIVFKAIKAKCYDEVQ